MSNLVSEDILCGNLQLQCCTQCNAMQCNGSVSVLSYNLCLFVSINSGSGIFARECLKLRASWGSCLSQWASSFSSGWSPIWEFQVVKMRVPAQSSIYWRSRKHQPTSLSSSYFAENTIFAGSHHLSRTLLTLSRLMCKPSRRDWIDAPHWTCCAKFHKKLYKLPNWMWKLRRKW